MKRHLKLAGHRHGIMFIDLNFQKAGLKGGNAVKLSAMCLSLLFVAGTVYLWYEGYPNNQGILTLFAYIFKHHAIPHLCENYQNIV